MNYSDKTVNELKDICKERKIQGISGKKKQELIDLIQQSSKPQSKPKSGISENVKMTISEVEDPSPRAKVEPITPAVKGGSYWYQKNKTDVPEYVKVIEIHKEGNDYYYTILMRNKTEKQTIGQYLFNWRKPPLYSPLPDENRERGRKIYEYGFIQGQFSTNTVDTQREWRFEDIVPKNEEDRNRLNCVYNQAVKETVDKIQTTMLDEFNKPYNKSSAINHDPFKVFSL